MKLVLFADGGVGLNIVQYLVDNYPQDIALVVTTQENEIYSELKKKNIPVTVFESVENVIFQLSAGVDLGILAWWPKILKGPLLEFPRLGFINTHPSLLPYNRGKHYNFWALVEQVPFGVTLHRVDAGIDTGDIVSQQEIAYDWRDTGESLYFKAQKAMLDLFCETYPVLRKGDVASRPQNKEVNSFHLSSEIEKASNIDLDAMYRGRDLLNLLRARTFEGYPGCWFEENGKRYEISIVIRTVDK